MDRKTKRRSYSWQEVVAAYVGLGQTVFGGNKDTIIALTDNLIDKLNDFKASVEEDKSRNEPWS